MLNRRVLVLGGAVSACSPARMQAVGPRVASLNPCLDTILINIADRGQIAALSHYAREPQSSTIADLARSLPFTYETAEEILSLQPDIVLASRHSSLATRQALERLGVKVAAYSVPNRIEDSLAQIIDIGQLIGRDSEAAGLVARIRAAIAEAEQGAGPQRIRALVFQARGLVAGAGTLIDEVMHLLGFDNLAARYGVKRWGNVSLEQLLAEPPDLLLSGNPGGGATAQAERAMRHPALAAVASHMHRAELPEACLNCGGPVLLQTLHALVVAREAYRAAR
jgi:iron complex transport system substrate-binding protein